MGMVLGALIGYTFIENRRIRLIYWGVGIPLLYLLAGGCAWLFIPLIWITEFCRFAGRRLLVDSGGRYIGNCRSDLLDILGCISISGRPPVVGDRKLSFSISLSTNAGDSLAGCDSGTVIGSSFAREDDLEILLGSMGSAIYPDVVCFESVWQIRYRVE